MQISPVSYLSSTSFGSSSQKCKKDCPQCSPNAHNPMITIPKSVYAALLAAVLGGPMLTSCEPMNPPTDPVKNITNPKDSSSVIPVDTFVVVPSVPTAASKYSDMIKSFGIATKTAALPASEGIKNGDVIEFGYLDGKNLYKLAINQELTTADTLVFDGTSKNNVTGQIVYHRHTVTPTDNGVVVNKQTSYDPPSESTVWTAAGTYKYVQTEAGVEEYKIYSDGSEHLQFTYEPKNETTIHKRIGESGYDLTDVSVTELMNTDTGLHDVYLGMTETPGMTEFRFCQ